MPGARQPRERTTPGARRARPTGDTVSLTAIALIAAAAAMHAGWNLLSKQAAQAGAVAFTWMQASLGTLIYAPVLAIYLAANHPHLRRGYAAGDLSQIYPLARGSGLLLSSFTAIGLYRERPGLLGIAGILLVAAGVTMLSLPDGAA